MYFLLRYMIAQGYQIVWLAHRSMLLEQTASTFYRNAALLRLADAERDVLKLICISGEHCSIHHADVTDDIIIGSVQSLSGRTDAFPFFLRAHEKFNFLDFNGRCYGYCPFHVVLQINLDRIAGAAYKEDNIEDVLVVWTA